ncbi:MAG TPA: hypothetical protein VHM24_01490 [Gemmatimonadaceae bacterium]|nr:hypothetical protein [Gemmatimonadaceae bacterium]
MRHKHLASILLLVGAAGCVEKTEPGAVPTLTLRATVTDTNDCSVNVLDKAYASKGQIRGDVPSAFVGTVANESYHGFGCWVGTTDGAGDLIVLFSQNNFGKPLAVGTYTPALEVLDDTPPMRFHLKFRTSESATERLTTTDETPGTVVVEATPSGGRIIKVNTEVVRWSSAF